MKELEGLKCIQSECNGEIIEVDDLMYNTLKILNEKGYTTKFSCSGHTTEPFLNKIYREDVYIVFRENIFELDNVVSTFNSILSNKFRRNNYSIHCYLIPFNDVYEFRCYLNELNLLLLKFAMELKPMDGYPKNNIVVSKRTEHWRFGADRIYEYDIRGNCIHFERASYQCWCKYDNRDNLTHVKDSRKFEEWYEYNENNKIIHYKNSDGEEYWKEYNENGELIQ